MPKVVRIFVDIDSIFLCRWSNFLFKKQPQQQVKKKNTTFLLQVCIVVCPFISLWSFTFFVCVCVLFLSIFNHITFFRHALHILYRSTARFDHPKQFNEISIETKRTNSASKLVVCFECSCWAIRKATHLFIYDDDIVPSHCMTSQLYPCDAKENLLRSHSESEKALLTAYIYSYVWIWAFACVRVCLCCCMLLVRTLTMSYRRNYIFKWSHRVQFLWEFAFSHIQSHWFAVFHQTLCTTRVDCVLH